METEEKRDFSNFTQSHRLPRWLRGKESTCQCRRLRFDPWIRKIPWRGKWQPNPVFLPEKSHGQSSLVGYSLWDHKESDITEQLSTQIIYRKHSILVFIIILSLKIDIAVIPWYLQMGVGEQLHF